MITADDFDFRFGNNNSPSDWPAVATEPDIVIRPGEGTSGTDRILLGWPGFAVRNGWLQVTALADERTGLSENDVFNFGSIPGDTNLGTTAFGQVNSIDQVEIRDHPTSSISPAAIDNPYDMNRDKSVNSNDRIVTRENPHGTLNPIIRLVAPTEVGEVGGGGATSLDSATATATGQASEAAFAQSVDFRTDWQPNRQRRHIPLARRSAISQQQVTASAAPTATDDHAVRGTEPSSRPLRRRHGIDRSALEQVFEELRSARI